METIGFNEDIIAQDPPPEPDGVYNTSDLPSSEISFPNILVFFSVEQPPLLLNQSSYCWKSSGYNERQ